MLSIGKLSVEDRDDSVHDPDMPADLSPLQAAVIARLAELGRDVWEAARIGGLDRQFFNDLIKAEKKKTVRGDYLRRMARGLDWVTGQLVEASEAAERGDDPCAAAAAFTHPRENQTEIDEIYLACLIAEALGLPPVVDPDDREVLAEALIEAARMTPGQPKLDPAAPLARSVAQALARALARRRPQ